MISGGLEFYASGKEVSTDLWTKGMLRGGPTATGILSIYRFRRLRVKIRERPFLRFLARVKVQ